MASVLGRSSPPTQRTSCWRSARPRVAQLGLLTGDAIVSLVVFVAIGSLTVAVLVAYALLGGASARRGLDELKAWLAIHNAAVMTVLFLVFGALIVAKGLGLLSD